MINKYARGYQSTNFFSDKQYYVNNAGVHKNVITDLKCVRDKGRSDYQLIVCLKGEIVVNGVSLNSKKGYLYFPNSPQKYEYKAVQGNEYYWIHFSGYGFKELLNSLNLKEGVLNLGENASKIAESISLIVSSYGMQIKFNEEYSVGQLLSILALSASPNLTPSPYLKAVNILSDLTVDIPVKDIAEELGFSEGYFIREFKKFTGLSPLAYKLKQRITLAKDMLYETDLTVLEISSTCGFEDATYFSRQFKKYEGVSPLEYRRLARNLN